MQKRECKKTVDFPKAGIYNERVYITHKRTKCWSHLGL